MAPFVFIKKNTDCLLLSAGFFSAAGEWIAKRKGGVRRAGVFYWYKSTCFAGTKMLVVLNKRKGGVRSAGTQFICFTGTKVQTLTLRA
jgi:hypothetical protein